MEGIGLSGGCFGNWFEWWMFWELVLSGGCLGFDLGIQFRFSDSRIK